MVRLRAELMDIASTRGAVLITGESGAGKELVAQAIHALGAGASRPFLAVNCAALPRELIESELFGHERGAFTGGMQSTPGLMRAARDGTIFLDEITEMPEALQPKLLRALEQRAVRPVGGLRELPVLARVLTATNSDPERAVQSGRLRADLFYRLCVHRIDVPPLRARPSDIPVLVSHFLRQLEEQGQRVPSRFSQASLDILQAYPWPGNVRELRNAVEHSCASARGGSVEPSHLPAAIARPTAELTSSNADGVRNDGDHEALSLRSVERRHIERVLRMAGGNKARAARLLGLSRHQLYLRLERLGLAID
jgi:two-component system response regulator AtoC